MVCGRYLLEQKLALPERYVADLWAVNDELGDEVEDAQPPPRIKKKSGRPPNA